MDYAPSAVRQAAAVLDAYGRAMTRDEIAGVLGGLSPHHCRLWESPPWPRAGSPGPDPVVADEAGRWRLDPRSAHLAPMRREVRRMGRAALLRRAEDARWAEVRPRRAVLRTAPEEGSPRAAALLDVTARTVETFTGAEVAHLAEGLARFDVLVGLHPRRGGAGRWEPLPPAHSAQVDTIRPSAGAQKLLVGATFLDALDGHNLLFQLDRFGYLEIMRILAESEQVNLDQLEPTLAPIGGHARGD